VTGPGPGPRRPRVLPIALAVATLVLAMAGPAAAATSGTISGASQAVCTPSPCLAPQGYTTVDLGAVSNDDGTSSARQFAVLRPRGLVPSPGNRAPAVLLFYAGSNCGYQGPGRWAGLAAPDRFVVIAMEASCAVDNWRKRNVDSPAPTAPDDEPYVAAVVRSIEQCPASSATAAQCIDPARVYAVGESSGGDMVADVMCDPQNSSLFRGYLIDSSSLELWNGAPDCPSTNRSYFVMMALSNYSIDAGLYYGTAPNPHLDVPAFADWAAARLGCTTAREDSAVGSPTASTLTYTYSAPCAYAQSGTAVETLGVINGGHGWGCQDSDPNAPPNPCPGMPVPPGVGPNGKPKTNGLFLEGLFWQMVAQGVSGPTPAPPLPGLGIALSAPRPGATVHGLVDVTGSATGPAVAGVQLEVDGTPVGGPVTPGPGGAVTLPWDTSALSDGPHTIVAVARSSGGQTSSSAPVVVTVANPLSQAVGAPLEALGDDFAAGTGLPPYLAGSGRRGDRCLRSPQGYAYRTAYLLHVPASSFGDHACAGATVSTLLTAPRGARAPAQRHWLGRRTRIVSLSVGWNDVHLGQALRSCVLGLDCVARYSATVNRALGRLAGAGKTSLRRLFAVIHRAAPKARVVVVGYPRLFPAAPPATCSAGVPGRRLSARTMRWLDATIDRLDRVLRRAARRARLDYVGPVRAFASHEWCTADPLLRAGFLPTSAGQTVLAALVAAAA
jgi:poly(3-hydroxybutyrate) depolymerase